MFKKTIRLDPETPDKAIITRAARIVQAGGLVLFPTTGLYGLGTDAMQPAAVQKIFDLKKRPPEKPVLILIDRVEALDRLVNTVPESALKIINAFWPGLVTMVFQARENLPDVLTAGTGKIGVRLPLHPVAKALVGMAGVPVTGTSANLSGQPGAAEVTEIDPAVTEGVDMVMDAGALMGGIGSTVVDVTTTPPRVLREGAVSAEQINAVL